MGTYSVDSITKYINFYEIINEETLNVCLQYLILTKKTNQTFIGGVLWTFIQKIIYFYLICLVQKDLNFLL